VIISGGLTKKDIGDGIRRALPNIKGCYEEALKTEPKLGGGRIAVDFKIGPDGAVVERSIKASSFGRSELESCVLGVASAMKFAAPRAGGTVLVTYPFNFTPTVLLVPAAPSKPPKPSQPAKPTAPAEPAEPSERSDDDP
jgi:TonB family protein